MNEKVKYWTELSEYDIKTAEAMLQNKRYLYVGFMAHQAIEKILKAYFVPQPLVYSQTIRYLQKLFRRAERFYRSSRTDEYRSPLSHP